MGKSSHTNHKSKRDLVLKQKKRAINPLTIVIGVAILMTAFAGAYYITDRGIRPAQSTQISTAAATAAASDVRYPVSLFEDGKARHFSHQFNGMTIRYFILKSADGVIRAAFDACDVCWQAGKGYYQEGDEMVCRNCGRRFASIRVNEVKGGCNPAPLNRMVEKDQLVIQVKDILEGQVYFKGV